MKKSKRRNKQNRLTITALALLLAIGVVGGTWAWFTDSATFNNEFKTGKFEDEIVEYFTPKDNWAPGDTVDKKVSVKNKGDIPLAVRVTFSEVWADGAPDHVSANTPAAIKNLNAGNVFNPTKTEVVTLANNAKWLIVYDNDGCCPLEAYYLTLLQASDGTTTQTDNITKELLTSVTMNQAITATTKSKGKDLYATKDQLIDESGNPINVEDLNDEDLVPVEYVNNGTSEDPDWVPGEVPSSDYVKVKTIFTTNSSSAYSDKNYTLTIKAETVQANGNAIKDVWANNQLGTIKIKDSDGSERAMTLLDLISTLGLKVTPAE